MKYNPPRGPFTLPFRALRFPLAVSSQATAVAKRHELEECGNSGARSRPNSSEGFFSHRPTAHRHPCAHHEVRRRSHLTRASISENRNDAALPRSTPIGRDSIRRVARQRTGRPPTGYAEIDRAPSGFPSMSACRHGLTDSSGLPRGSVKRL